MNGRFSRATMYLPSYLLFQVWTLHGDWNYDFTADTQCIKNFKTGISFISAGYWKCGQVQFLYIYLVMHVTVYEIRLRPTKSRFRKKIDVFCLDSSVTWVFLINCKTLVIRGFQHGEHDTTCIHNMRPHLFQWASVIPWITNLI